MPPILRNVGKKLLLKYAPPEIVVFLKHLESKGSKAFPKKNICVANTLSVGAVLILAPHPDDEAIGMGGSLSMHPESKYKVTVLYMTDGRGVGNTTFLEYSGT